MADNFYCKPIFICIDFHVGPPKCFITSNIYDVINTKLFFDFSLTDADLLLELLLHFFRRYGLSKSDTAEQVIY